MAFSCEIMNIMKFLTLFTLILTIVKYNKNFIKIKNYPECV